MAVFDGLWWSAWWPWMTVWLVTVAGVAVLAAVLAHHARERRRQVSGRKSPYSICFFLDEQAVMDLYRSNFGPVLEQAVEHHTNVNTNVGLIGKLLPWTVKANRDVTQEEFTSYVQKNEPITVIGVVLEAFERADAIVHADLRSGTVQPNQALTLTLDGDSRVALSDVDDFVSVSGRFRMDPDTSEGIVLRTSYNGGQAPPYLRVVGTREGLRRETIPRGTFKARCLGIMTDWVPESGEVTLEAIAIFR